MRKSSEHSQKQQKQGEMQNEIVEQMRSHYIPNQYRENHNYPVPFNFDYHQIAQRRTLFDYQPNQHSLPVFNNQQLEQVNQHTGVCQFDLNHNRRQNFLQPNFIPAPNNMLSLIWSYSHPSEHVQSEVKKQENNYAYPKQYIEWHNNVSFQVKDQHIDEEISHYINNTQYPQKVEYNPKPRFFQGQNIQYRQMQQNQFVNPIQTFVKLESGICQQNLQLKFRANSPSKTKRQLRRQKVEKYLRKKNSRDFSKKITYICRKEVADKRIRLKGRFINYKQAVQQLKLDPSEKYEVSFLKQLIKRLDESTSLTPRSTPNFNPEQTFGQDKSCKDPPLLNIDGFQIQNSEHLP